MKEIQVCPGTLAEGFNSYSPKSRKEMFNGKKVNHILPFASFLQSSDVEQKKLLASKSLISISGVQEKYSLSLKGSELEVTDTHGQYILKPISTGVANPDLVPANEHLTMQIAGQVFKLPVAKSALIFFSDGQPAYITKRFDVKDDGSRCLKEDFASLAQVTDKTSGKGYKYDYNYERMAQLIDEYFPASIKAKEDFFRLIVFNYLFSNGDAHLKNFSRLDCEGNGDGFLAPAYDLINTRLHVDDSDLALTGGLYEDDIKFASYQHYGCYCFDDFYEFGKRIGLVPARAKKMIEQFLLKKEDVESLIKRSFLPENFQEKYYDYYKEKLRRLQMSLTGLV